MANGAFDRVVSATGVTTFCVSLCMHSHLVQLLVHSSFIRSQGVESLTRPSPPSSSSSSFSLGPWCGLRRLLLSYNSLGPTVGLSLARMLRYCTTLQDLQLDSCGLTSSVLAPHTGLQEALKGKIGSPIPEEPELHFVGLTHSCQHQLAIVMWTVKVFTKESSTHNETFSSLPLMQLSLD